MSGRELVDFDAKVWQQDSAQQLDDQKPPPVRALPGKPGAAHDDSVEGWFRLILMREAPPATPLRNLAYQRVYPTLLWTARRLLAGSSVTDSRHDAEEAVQEWCLVTIRCDHKFDTQRSAGAFAFGILWIVCRAIARRCRRVPSLTDTSEWITSEAASVDVAISQETFSIVRKSLQRQTALHRRALVEQFWEGLRATDSAERHGTTLAAAQSARFRARQAVKEDLHRYGCDIW